MHTEPTPLLGFGTIYLRFIADDKFEEAKLVAVAARELQSRQRRIDVAILLAVAADLTPWERLLNSTVNQNTQKQQP